MVTPRIRVVTPPPPKPGKSADVAALAAALPDAAEELGQKRPEFIVVFRERSPRNVTAISSALNVGAAPVSARAGRAVLNNNHEWAARPRVYERMGVAAVDLDPDEKRTLEHDDSVAAIVRNETRRLPPIREHDERTGIPERTAPAPIAPLLRFDSAFEDDPRLAYVVGMRDALDQVVRALAGASPTRAADLLAPVAPAATGPTRSWTLDLIRMAAGYAPWTGKGVRIAVLDTGIDLNHPDFAGRFAGTGDFKSFVPGESAQDGHGHGTHCAGVIAGSNKPAGGRVFGVAPGVDLLVGKVLNNAGEGYDDRILDAIDWAADAGAQIISMSLGSVRRAGEPYSKPYETVAANYLATTPGVLIVAAAGNESARDQYTMPVGNPAACPSIVSVAALDSLRRIAPFSCAAMDSIGAVDVSGPGVGIYSTWKGGGYKTISGTSMATPHASAICALLLEAYPTLTARQLWDKLASTCQTLLPRADFGAGLIQAP